ncbi:MAG: aminomethyltransferase beta-barrel domain-containing protein, partial [Pseudomonadota bacterium]|nr:aminomethyltransferase beta-barrel domain-containing protein [Pseudomonadota bacterium]
VADKDLARNVLVVVQGHDHAAMQRSQAWASQLAWVASEPPARAFECTAKVRYRQADQPCSVEVLADGRCHVRFRQPQRAVTPGQYVVFYSGDVCLGGGVVDRTA